ncbi:alpha-hydroxy acid oxidase [Nocardioides speluncae]|uniref:alpha-hydroxy acid oxidase n=1 Tax=Nocardioides speluncae TaxID=2670337 RepID=UPI000D68F7B5|nr:alpha-hydroxy acid oxidase [Nocardioides speluncae]
MRERWLDGVEKRARDSLPAAVYRYLMQGAREGVSAAEAVSAWQSVRFVPHVLRDVTEVDTATTLLGTPVATPVGIAPTTLQRAVHPEGELAMARATAAAGSLMVVSSNAGTRFAEIGATGVSWWLQAYVPADRSLAEPLLARAVEAGAKAVVLTVDTPVVGTKYDGDNETIWDLLPGDVLRVNFDDGYDDRPGAAKATDLGVGDIAWLGEITGLPVVAKGVVRPDDARRCVQAGCAAIWVSNHGGRQLDRTISTAAALPAIASAIGPTAELYVDGGIRSGLDVMAATALGARGVFLGRLPVLSLAGGEQSVRRLHAELADELVEAMRLGGCTRLSDTPAIVSHDPGNRL